MIKIFRVHFVITSLAVVCSANAYGQVLYEAFGANRDSIEQTVNEFAVTLGELNPNVPMSFHAGRREIDWESVPDNMSDPNMFDGTLFIDSTEPYSAGLAFRTPGSGMMVSSNSASGQPIEFGVVSGWTQPYSGERVFAPVGSNTTEIFVSSPDGSTSATTNGFGLVLSGVDWVGSTKVKLFDENNELLNEIEVTPTDPFNSLHFVGAIFDEPVISHAEITSGSMALLGSGRTEASGDFVVLDNIIFGEPFVVAEPASPLFALGLMLMVVTGRIRSKK